MAEKLKSGPLVGGGIKRVVKIDSLDSFIDCEFIYLFVYLFDF